MSKQEWRVAEMTGRGGRASKEMGNGRGGGGGRRAEEATRDVRKRTMQEGKEAKRQERGCLSTNGGLRKSGVL